MKTTLRKKTPNFEIIQFDILSIFLVFAILVAAFYLSVNFLKYNMEMSQTFNLVMNMVFTGVVLYAFSYMISKKQRGMYDQTLDRGELKQIGENIMIGFTMITIFTIIGISFTPRFSTINDAVLKKVLGMLVGVGEEVTFRGGLFNFLRVLLKNDYVALIVQAIGFGLAHAAAYNGNIQMMVIAIMAGLVFGYIDLKVKKLTPSMVTHVLWNAL